MPFVFPKVSSESLFELDDHTHGISALDKLLENREKRDTKNILK